MNGAENSVAEEAHSPDVNGWEFRQFVGLLLPSKFIKSITLEPADIPVISVGLLTSFGVVPVMATSKNAKPLSE